jgi:hypothetical protein
MNNVNTSKENYYLSVFVSDLNQIQVLSIFDGTIKGHVFVLPISKDDIKTAVHAIEYCLAGIKFDLSICN